MTTKLAAKASIIALETLNVIGMLKNHTLARSIADAALSEMVRQFTYKAQRVVYINRTYAVVWSTHLFAFGRAVLFLFLVSNFRRRRKLETKSESLPRCRRRKRRGVETTA